MCASEQARAHVEHVRMHMCVAEKACACKSTIVCVGVRERARAH